MIIEHRLRKKKKKKKKKKKHKKKDDRHTRNPGNPVSVAFNRNFVCRFQESSSDIFMESHRPSTSKEDQQIFFCLTGGGTVSLSVCRKCYKIDTFL